MKIRAEASEFIRKFNIAKAALNQKSPSQVMQFVHATTNGDDTLCFSGVSGDISIMVTAEVQIEEHGEAMLDPMIGNIVPSGTKGKISLLTNKREVKLKVGKSEPKFGSLDATAFPTIEGFQTSFKVDFTKLATAIKHGGYAHLTDKSTTKLSGVFVRFYNDGVNVKSADGNRLADVSVGDCTGEFVDALVMPDALNTLKNLWSKPTDELNIGITDSRLNCYITADGTEIAVAIPRMGYEYPVDSIARYLNVEPVQTIKVSAAALQREIKLAQMMTGGEKALNFVVSGDSVRLVAQLDDKRYNGEIDCTGADGDFWFALNIGYLSELFSLLSGEVELQFCGFKKPVYIVPVESPTHKHCIMTMALPGDDEDGPGILKSDDDDLDDDDDEFGDDDDDIGEELEDDEVEF